MRLVFLLINVLIIYGSLYPFQWQASALSTDGFARLLGTLGEPSGRGDLLGNIVLFLPFGYIGLHALEHPRARFARGLTVAILAVPIAVGVQIAQIGLVERVPSLQDAVWNLLGTALGVLVALILPAPRAGNLHWRGDAVGAMLAATWLGYRLVPFVPSFDWGQFKDSLKPLLVQPEFTLLHTLHTGIGWLVFGYLGAKAVPRLQPRLLLFAAIGASYALELLIEDNAVTASDVAGAAGALLIATTRFYWTRRAALILALLLGLLIAFQGLEPFYFSTPVRPFHWLPFTGFLHGSMGNNSAVLLEKVFLYGSALWLLRANGMPWTRAAQWCAFATAVIEWSQRYLPAHTPEITDPLLVVLIALLLRGLETGTARQARGRTP